MRETPEAIESEPWASPRATAIYRKVDDQPQIVIICEACDYIHTITVAEAMRVALNNQMKFHGETHLVSTADARFSNHEEGK